MSEHPERWLSELYRASAREEPPRSLDAAILGASRRDGRSWGWLSRALSNWQAPLAAAAVIVVAVTVVIAVHDDSTYPDRVALQDDESAARMKAAAPSLREPLEKSQMLSSKQQAESEPKRALNRGNAASEPASVNEQRSELSAESSEKFESDARLPAANVPAATPPAASAPVASAPAPGASEHAVAEPALTNVPAREVIIVPNRSVPTSPPAQAQASTAPVPAAAPPSESGPHQRDMREQAQIQAAPASPAAKAFGKLSAVPQSEAERRARADEQVYRQERQEKSVSNEASRRLDSQVDDPAAREAWLENILKLRKEGRHADAKESLAAFKKRYPDYPLPPTLKELRD